MNPFKHIKETNDVVKDLKFKLQYSKNKAKDVKQINTIIDCLKSFEDILEQKYKVSEIDNLLCYIFNEFMITQEQTPKQDIQLDYLIDKINCHLKADAQNNISSLAMTISSYEFGKKYLNGDIKGCERFAKNTSKEDIVKLIKDLFFKFKQSMLWRIL